MRFDLTVRKGFTLIELMVVVTIIAVLATLGGIKYVRYREYTGGVACNAYLQAIQNARIAYATDNNGQATNEPRWLTGYMASTDGVTSYGSAAPGQSFRCPFDISQAIIIPNPWGDPATLPMCNYEVTHRGELQSKFPNFELHTLGGYRTFNDLPAGE